ncbi:MAG: response regulator, partial [Anaerolineae bacterium]|nr:response regulator [Anaerolineae bacterium]
RAAVEAVVALQSNLAKQHGISLSISEMPPGLVAGVNPSLMRQMLVTAISYFLEQTTVVEITLRATRSGESAIIVVAGGPAAVSSSGKAQLLREIGNSQGGSVEITTAEDTVSFVISLPSPAIVRVLVVDDNEDQVHFYRRCTRGTRYQISHAPTAQHLISVIHTSPPDILVLDIMLPDIDGWELLTLLHEDTNTRDLPVIVCSVMREQELALSLGATLYLPKPIQHHEFIHALDQVLPLVQEQPSRN